MCITDLHHKCRDEDEHGEERETFCVHRQELLLEGERWGLADQLTDVGQVRQVADHCHAVHRKKKKRYITIQPLLYILAKSQ